MSGPRVSQRKLDFSREQNSVSRQVLIRASAGTGKTFQLSSRYLNLLRRDSVDRILASTFTRKAAGEILERVLTQLAGAVLDESQRRFLSSSLGSRELSRDECSQLLQELARNLHRVRIGTLDSFNAQLAGSYSLELGFPPGWEILDPASEESLNERAIEQLLDSADVEEVSQLTHLLGHGGPGRSVADLVHNTVTDLYSVFRGSAAECWQWDPPGGLLTNEKIGELLEEIEAVSLSDGHQRNACSRDCALIREGNWEELAAAGLAKAFVSGDGQYRNKPLDPALRGPYLKLIGHARALVVKIWREQTAAAQRLLSHFHEHRRRLQRRQRALSFEDVTRALGDRSAISSSDFRLNASLSHLLLDEFQDTSPAQWNVLRPLVESAVRRDEGSFFCVGDSKQAIYGWRGGEAAIFDTIERHFPGIVVLPLDQSRRSSPVIMDVVNLAMRNLAAHDNYPDAELVLAEWCREFPAHSTARQELPGYVCLETTRETTGGSHQRNEDAGEEDEASSPRHIADVAARILQLSREAPQATMGVLTRSNSLVGELIFELHRLGVPASEEGGNPLTDSAAVRVVLALLTLADHPGNSIARFHVVESPLGNLAAYASVRGDAGAERAALRIRMQLLERGYAGFVRETATALQPACNAREARRLAQLVTVAEDYDRAHPSLRPGDFVSHVRTQRRQEPTDALIRVMNLHQSKGLEFDIVVLPELDGRLVQSSFAKAFVRSPQPGEPPDFVALSRDRKLCELAQGDVLEAREQTLHKCLREALCLLYVGMTRAVHSLHLMVKTNTNAKLPRTSAGLLRAALGVTETMAPGIVLYERGDPRWFENVDWSAREEESDALKVTSSPAPASISFAAAAATRRLPRAQPSQLHHAKITGVATLLAENNQSALDRGTLFHRWLERITWLADDESRTKDLLQLGRGDVLDERQLVQFVKEFQGSLKQPEIAALFNRSIVTKNLCARYHAVRGAESPPNAAAVSHNEWRFSRIDEGVLVNGSIDRLVTLRSGGKCLAAEVIDYKTDALGPRGELLPERLAFHREQMHSYRQAVAEFLEIDPAVVWLQLVFLGGGRVVEVD